MQFYINYEECKWDWWSKCRYELLRFILTMRNVNFFRVFLLELAITRFILTMRNVNSKATALANSSISSFILTMRNVNFSFNHDMKLE